LLPEFNSNPMTIRGLNIKRTLNDTTYYVHDATGNVMGIYVKDDLTLTTQERPIYGSSRLGILNKDVKSLPSAVRRLPSFFPSLTDYYPFGYPIASRTFSIEPYRYGFNGKEYDNEIYDVSKFQDYGMRMYDTRLARFWGVDPLLKAYPSYSTYQFAGNNPIIALDLNGKEELHYLEYQQGMINGYSQFKLIKFPTINKSVWQDPNNYKDNPYWTPVKQEGIHPSTLALKEGKKPSDGINHIFENPDQYTMECAQFVQLVKLYGMLQSMGSEEFDKYIKEQNDGQFLLTTHQSTGIQNTDVITKINGKWPKGFNEKKFVKDAIIGTEYTLKTDELKGTLFEYENIVKVGDDQYLAQGITNDTPMSLNEIKTILAKKGNTSVEKVEIYQIKKSNAKIIK